MRILTRFLVILIIILGASMGEAQANSVENLTIIPITWNVIGLDSNNVNVGPNTFPVGARVCNVGSEPANNLEATFVWESANTLINLRQGSLNTIPHESLAPGDCVDFYFEVEITRNASAYTTTRRYHIEVRADDLAVISTATPREIYVERLISQNRNATLDVKLDGISIAPGGNMTLMVGQTYNITLIAKTATQGYEQIESFINFPNTIFQILDVETIYSSDTSAHVDNPSDLLYGDGCLWQNDPNSPAYLSCLSTGKVGGNITVNYTVKIIGGSGTSNILNTLVYDFSGASYHYNSDFSTSSRIASIVSANLSKTFVPKSIQPGGTASLVFKITNPSTSMLNNLNFTDELPEGMSISSSTINYTGCGSPTPFSLSVGSSMLSFSNISVAGLGTCTITVSVTASTEKLYVNTTGNLFIGEEDTGDSGTDTLLVASTGVCLPGQQLVTWTFPTGSSATTPLFTTKSSNVTTALASTTTSTPAIVANTGNPPPSWSGQGFSSGAYFQFQVDTSRYTDVKIYFDHITSTQNWNTTAAVTLSSSTNGTTFTTNTLSSGSTLLDASLKRATFNTTVGSTYFRISATGAQNNNARMAIDNVTLTGCLEPAPSPTITKSFAPDPIKLGSTSTLTFTISNTASGNVAQTGISFTDILPDGLSVLDATTSACNGTNNLVTSSSNRSITLTGGSLAAGATCTIQVPVIGVVQGLHENISGFLSSDQSGTTTSYATDTLTVIAPPQIIKTFGSTAILLEESTSLTFTISNPNTTTPLTGISFIDTLPAGVEVENASSSVCNGTLTTTNPDSVHLSGASLLPGTSCTFTVMVSGTTQGLKENSVTVTSLEGGTGNTDEASMLVKAHTPALTFLKQVGPTLTGPWASFLSVNIADPVFYLFIIENTGDVSLTGITLSDPEIYTSGCLWLNGDGIPFVDDDLSSPGFSFSLPIADDDEGHLAYCVLDPDLLAEAGSHTNTASADSSQTIPVTSSATYATPGITLMKTVQETYYSAEGENLHYSYLVENTGSVPLLGPVEISDDKTTVNCPAVTTVGDLDNYFDPGESLTCSADYSVKAEDITAGSVTNTALASIAGISSQEDSVTVPYRSPADLQIQKTNSTANIGLLGTPFTWTINISNQGGSDASFAEGTTILSDTLPAGATYGTPSVNNINNVIGFTNLSCQVAANVLTCISADGAVVIGATTGSFVVNILVTPAIAGNLLNTASVDPDNTIPEMDETNNSATNTVFIADPGISISKQVSTDESTWLDSVIVNVGDTVYFQITVVNTGNIPLSGVAVKDDQCTLTGPSGDTNTDGLLDTDETWTYTCSLTAIAGTNTNTASADSDQTTESTDSAEYFGNDPGISISKKVSSDESTWLESVTVNVGDTVYFQITVVNTGNIPLSGVDVNDDQCTLTGPSGDTNTDGLLDTDETWTYTCSVMAAAGANTNSATVDSDQTGEDDDTADYFGNDPQLSLDKSGSLDLTVIPPVDEVNPGDEISYTYTLTNTGNAIINGPFIVDDDKVSVTCPETPTILQPDSSIICTATYTITQSDIENGSVTNIATGSNGTIYSNDDTVTINLLHKPLLGLAKYVVGSPETIGMGTWKVTFEILVQNYGNVTLYNLQVEDNLQATFPLPSTYVVAGLNSDTFDVNWPGYDGVADKNLLSGTDQLDPDASGKITMVIEVVPANDGPFLNSAFGRAETGNGDPVGDYSQRGTSPDPDQDGDPTNNNLPTPVEFGSDLFNSPSGLKSVDASQLPRLQWQIIWVNNTNLVGIQVTSSDPIPAGTAFFNNLISSGYPLPVGDLPAGSVNSGVKCHTAGTTITQHCYYEGPTNQYPRGRVIWQGTLAPDPADVILQNAQNAVKIDFSVTVNSGVTSVVNTATVDVDLNGDGDTDDVGEQSTTIVSSDWQSTPLPEALPVTGFRPAVTTSLASKPLDLVYSQKGLTLEIPKLGLSSAIVGIPLTNQGWQTDWLFSQIGYLEGTAFPTWNGNTVLTAHVYDANGLPGPFVNLSKLGWGDQLVIHAWGQKYVYEVRTVDQRVNPADTSYLQHEEKDWLTLITCQGYDQELNAYRWRVVVRAVLVKID